ARPGGRRMTTALAGTIVASSVSFGLYFVIAGTIFLDAYQLPQYEYQDWQLLAAVPLGLFAAAVTAVLGLVMRISAALLGGLKAPGVVKSTLGGDLLRLHVV